MAIYDTLKDLAGLAQKAGMIDLYRQAVELMQQVTEQQQQITTLNDKVKSLTEQLQLREQMTRKDDAHWKADGSGPYCSRCYEVDGKAVSLNLFRPMSRHVAERYICPQCKSHVGKVTPVVLSDVQRQKRGPTIEAYIAKNPPR